MIRKSVLSIIAVLTVLAVASPASAHVTVQPPQAEAGGFTKLAFRTPNERDDAATTKLEVFFPEDHVLVSASVRPLPGWEATIEMRELEEPVEVFGEPRTEAVASITWEGGTIEPGQFQEFEVSVGPLPEEPGQLVFKSIQTYSSGEVVRWIEEPTDDGEEPELPAPVLELVEAGDAGGGGGHGGRGEDAETAAPADEDDDDGVDAVAIAALVVAVLALVVAGLAVARRR